MALTAAFETDRAEAAAKLWPFARGQAGRRSWYLGYMRGIAAGLREGYGKESPVTELPSAVYTEVLRLQRAKRDALLAEIRSPEYQARRNADREDLATRMVARQLASFGRRIGLARPAEAAHV